MLQATTNPQTTGTHSSFDYGVVLRKMPRQQRSKDCISDVFASALLLLDYCDVDQLTVEAVASKSGHGGSTISEWFDLNNKELFVSCAARHHAQYIIAHMKTFSMGMAHKPNIHVYVNKTLEICMPPDIKGQIALYHAWQNLEQAEQWAFVHQIKTQVRSIFFRDNSSFVDHLLLAPAIWAICADFNRSVLLDREMLNSRPQAIQFIKNLVADAAKKYPNS